MSSESTKLLEDALKLPEADRADLAAFLFASLEPELVDSLDPSWEEEISRRIQEIDSGKVQLIPWEEARKRMFGNG